MKILSLFCAALSALFSTCGKEPSADDWQQVSKVVYRHSDPSVAPDYYRSYTLTVTANSIALQVNNYSDTLLSKSFPISKESFHSFIEKLSQLGIKKVKEVESISTGGSTQSLCLYHGDDEFFNAYRTHDGGNLSLPHPLELQSLIDELLPSIHDLVEQTRGE